MHVPEVFNSAWPNIPMFGLCVATALRPDHILRRIGVPLREQASAPQRREVDLDRNRELLERFLASPRTRIADVDEGTAERYATIFASLRRRGTPIPTNDLWIAASAMQHGLRLVTLDSDFEKVQQILVSRYDA